jgi:hypothetical protein
MHQALSDDDVERTIIALHECVTSRLAGATAPRRRVAQRSI